MLGAKGQRKMLAAVLILSIFSGLAAVGVAVMLDLSPWMTLCAYPLGGGIGVFIAAAIASAAAKQSAAVLVPAVAAPLARRL
jgi:hypothetical protein